MVTSRRSPARISVRDTCWQGVGVAQRTEQVLDAAHRRGERDDGECEPARGTLLAIGTGHGAGFPCPGCVRVADAGSAGDRQEAELVAEES